jgi:hypothetical protein
MPADTDARDIAQGQEHQLSDAERMEISNQTAIQEAELARQKQDELPDDAGEEAELKAEFAKKEAEYQKKLKALESDRETFDKRLRDTQHKLHMVTAEQAKFKQEPEKKEEKSPSFDEYIKGIAESFEEDPRSAVQKIVTDFAADRELMRRQYKQEMEQMREAVLNEVLMQNPENAQLMAEVEVLNETRPDLNNLTNKQKIEYVKLMKQAEGGKNGKTTRQVADNDESFTDRSLLSSTRRTASRGSGLPSWASSPEVQAGARGVFESKKEMIDWLNPDKAMEMARKMARKE